MQQIYHRYTTSHILQFTWQKNMLCLCQIIVFTYNYEPKGLYFFPIHIYLWHCFYLRLTFLLAKHASFCFAKRKGEGMFSICSDQKSVKASAFSLDSGATDWAASESSKHPVTHASAEPQRASWTIWGLCRLKCFRGEISWSCKHAVHIIKLS